MAFIKQRNKSEANSFSDIGKQEQIPVTVIVKLNIFFIIPNHWQEFQFFLYGINIYYIYIIVAAVSNFQIIINI